MMLMYPGDCRSLVLALSYLTELHGENTVTPKMLAAEMTRRGREINHVLVGRLLSQMQVCTCYGSMAVHTIRCDRAELSRLQELYK